MFSKRHRLRHLLLTITSVTTVPAKVKPFAKFEINHNLEGFSSPLFKICHLFHNKQEQPQKTRNRTSCNNFSSSKRKQNKHLRQRTKQTKHTQTILRHDWHFFFTFVEVKLTNKWLVKPSVCTLQFSS